MKVNNCTICNHALVCPNHGTLGMEISLNEKISNILGCNLQGRIEYALRLLEGGDVSQARIKLKGLLIFIKED